MKITLRFLFTVLFSYSFLFSFSQENDAQELYKGKNGRAQFARLKNGLNIKMTGAAGFLKKFLQAAAPDEFRLVKETTDELGITHRRFQQYYNNIKVEDGEYLVHGKNKMIETVNGDFQVISNMPVTPSLDEKNALARVLAYVHAKKYKWEDPASEKDIKGMKNDPQATYFPKGELVVAAGFLKNPDQLYLAWKFHISSLEPNKEELVYADAVSGEIVRVTDLVCTINTPCTAQTRYSGTQAFTGDSFAGGFRLQETRNSVNVQTLNIQSQSNYGSAIDFTNNNTNWTNGSWGAFTQDRAALDAHWGSERVLDYWRTVHNRNSINNAGMPVISYVHYFDAGSGAGWPNNAQWDGANNRVRYGDGNGFLFNPLTSLDVCAHEIGHGITQFTSALTYNNQESGALNEGFSDIWGACVERWAEPGKQAWLIGEEVMANGNTCLRNMQDPNSATAQTRGPATYHGTFWDWGGEQHINSTVLSHWFFLVAEGPAGGIGINDAQRIAYRAAAFYLNSSANYAAARTATIQAARDLFGIGSCQEITVTDAWFTVGVGAAASHSFNIWRTFSQDCSSVTVNAATPSGANITWVTTNGLLINGNASPFTTTANVVTISSPSGNPGYISASYGSGACAVQSSTSIYFCPCPTWPDNPYINWIYSAPATNEPLMAEVIPAFPDAAEYHWYINGQLIEITYGTFFSSYRWPCTSEGEGLSVFAISWCGASQPVYGGTYSPICYGAKTSGIKLFPNPASYTVSIKLEEEGKPGAGSKLLNGLTEIRQVKIIDKLGFTRKIVKYNAGSKTVLLSIADLPADVYYMEIRDQKQSKRIPLVVRR